MKKRLDEVLRESIKRWEGSGAYEDVSDFDKIVYYAYMVGRMEATKKVSDDYTSVLRAQIERAENCVHHNEAMKVQGGVRYLYHIDYAGDFYVFGSDMVEVPDDNNNDENRA